MAAPVDLMRKCKMCGKLPFENQEGDFSCSIHLSYGFESWGPNCRIDHFLNGVLLYVWQEHTFSIYPAAFDSMVIPILFISILMFLPHMRNAAFNFCS